MVWQIPLRRTPSHAFGSSGVSSAEAPCVHAGLPGPHHGCPWPRPAAARPRGPIEGWHCAASRKQGPICDQIRRPHRAGPVDAPDSSKLVLGLACGRTVCLSMAWPLASCADKMALWLYGGSAVCPSMLPPDAQAMRGTSSPRLHLPHSGAGREALRHSSSFSLSSIALQHCGPEHPRSPCSPFVSRCQDGRSSFPRHVRVPQRVALAYDR